MQRVQKFSYSDKFKFFPDVENEPNNIHVCTIYADGVAVEYTDEVGHWIEDVHQDNGNYYLRGELIEGGGATSITKNKRWVVDTPKKEVWRGKISEGFCQKLIAQNGKAIKAPSERGGV